MKPLTFLLILLMTLPMLPPAWAEILTLDESEIASRMVQNHTDFKSFTADMEMKLMDADGEKQRFTLRFAVSNGGSEGVKKVFRVNQPENLKGTALLIHAAEDRESEVWFYLSARKRVKRIYPIFQTGSFLNTGWTYEDMVGYETDKYSHRIIGNGTLNGNRCFMVEAVPGPNRGSGYSRQIRWIDAATHDLLKVEFYNQDGKLQKTVSLTGHETLPGNFRHPTLAQMIDHQSGNTLSVAFSNFDFNANVESSSLNVAGFFKWNGKRGTDNHCPVAEVHTAGITTSPNRVASHCIP